MSEKEDPHQKGGDADAQKHAGWPKEVHEG